MAVGRHAPYNGVRLVTLVDVESQAKSPKRLACMPKKAVRRRTSSGDFTHCAEADGEAGTNERVITNGIEFH
jgi:hypothetical protein